MALTGGAVRALKGASQNRPYKERLSRVGSFWQRLRQPCRDYDEAESGRPLCYTRAVGRGDRVVIGTRKGGLAGGTEGGRLVKRPYGLQPAMRRLMWKSPSGVISLRIRATARRNAARNRGSIASATARMGSEGIYR